ncbi:YqiA/YcfP family alpha/beta fold hydrolase [Leeuwenhoekiella sp. MAR_2009_132]|uniref:YqiA/YcfP family alpha/beta fold hydrolase n=1 Tax=Leeuwenhoekiella sp. MAR_2009_132 TaxID=1392489 RepID=UPI000490180A|nr:YqiA/YcfP family alpha/beta fold hydrolase [Leeuwenhoekiella sp. MAR_2009_132]
MTILYLHGLESKLSAAKKAILEQYATVIAPDLDYKNNPDAVQQIYEIYKTEAIDYVMGSSMGGFAAYHLGLAFNKPVLLFNPALVKRSVVQNIPDFKAPSSGFGQVVLGGKDTVVDPSDTLSFLGDQLKRGFDYHVHLRAEMSHRTPKDIFEEEVGLFFELQGIVR